MIEWAVTKGQDTDFLSRWVAEIIWPGRGKDFGRCQGMAVIEDGKLIAGAIWHNWDEDNGVVEISGAGTSKRWLTRQTLNAMFGIPFAQFGVQAIVMRVSDDDEALHRMLKACDFIRHRIPRLRGRNEAENVFVLTDDAWARNRLSRPIKEVE